MESFSAERILDAFADDRGRYPRKALDAAVDRAEELTPHFLGALESLLSDPDRWLDNGETTHVYASILLAHWREVRAHPLFLRLFRLPDELLDPLFGDMITECFPAFLLRTCGGSFEGIRGLARDRSADEYCRGAALEALALAVPLGLASREEVVEFFGSLFASPDEAEPGSGFWDALANAATDLYPQELLPAIREAYEEALLVPRAISLAEVEMELARGQEATLADLAQKAAWRVPDDVHGYLSWSESMDRERAADRSAARNSRAKADKAKRRKKIAKTSKRRNRR